MFHRFGLYRVNSLHSFISQTEIHTGPSLGVFETWVRLSYFSAFVNTSDNVRQAGEITAKTAMEQTGTKRTSFYKLVNMTETQ